VLSLDLDNIAARNAKGNMKRILLGTPMPKASVEYNFLRINYLVESEESYREGLNRALHFYFDKTVTVHGLYLNSYLLPTFELKLEAANNVFGTKKYSVFPIGEYFPLGCGMEVDFSESFLEYLHRLDFLACRIQLKTYPDTPVEAADDIISECDEIQSLAEMYGIQANITCVVCHCHCHCMVLGQMLITV